jgi:tRNA(Ile)-lysidine synthase
MSLLDRFEQHLESLDLDPCRALVAVSGGPDSLALLDLMDRAAEERGLDLVVAHVDHGIHPESATVAERVRRLAGSYGLPYEEGRLNLGSGAGETLARERRYGWLENARERIGAELIFTAHHADDQVETVLMRVLAGSGPAGLAGMAARQGRVVRPLLPYRRSELEEYLEEVGLTTWSDPANSDPRHLRSWIRTELLPLLQNRVPQIGANLARMARQAASDRAAWDSVLDVLPGLELRAEPDGISVAAPALAGYDSALTQATILALARRAGCPLGPTRAGRVLSLIQTGSSGHHIPLSGPWSAELSFGRLRLYRSEAQAPAEPHLLSGMEGSGVWGRWRFQWKPDMAPARQDRTGLSAWFSAQPLTIRAWSPGDKVRPLGGTGHRLIVRCFQEAKVPQSNRGSWPVVAGPNDVLWIPGVCRSGAGLPHAGKEALRVDAEYA